MSDVLQVADVALIGYSSCEALYAGSTTDLFGYNGTTGLICAAGFSGGATAGSGNGDSGGPLLMVHDGGLKQIGVVYGGEGQYATATYPGVYTTVAYAWPWIQGLITGSTAVQDLGPGDPTIQVVPQQDGNLLITVPQSLGTVRAEFFTMDGRFLYGSERLAAGAQRVPWPSDQVVVMVRVLEENGTPVFARLVPRAY
jgi:hypothetical protein